MYICSTFHGQNTRQTRKNCSLQRDIFVQSTSWAIKSLVCHIFQVSACGKDIKEHSHSLSTLSCCPEFFYAEVKEAWTQGYYNFSRNDAASLPRWTSQLRFQSLFMCSAQFSLTLILAPKTFSRSYFLSCSMIVLIYMWHLSVVLSSSGCNSLIVPPFL